MIISFLPINCKIETNSGSNLFSAAIENGIDLGGVCSGNKTCGKCKVLITKGNNLEFRKEEMDLLTESERKRGIRLACCFTIVEDTCVILLHNENRSGNVTFKNKKEIVDHKSNEIISEKESSKIERPLTGKSQNYGIAIDLGTTSVAAKLWNLNTGKSLGQMSVLNPQSRYGADVLSRITYAAESPENRLMLTDLIRKGCNTLIRELAGRSQIKPSNIKAITAAGNTIMTNLFLGREVDKLAKIPFTGISYEGEERSPSDMGFEISEDGSLYVLPGIGGHVGADTLGCILACSLYDTKETILLVDIGTNGEIVLSRKGKMTVCSTAAGPAFEGASLYQGMRAVNGAITKVFINKGNISIDYIGAGNGNIEPVGICGSGIIEAASEFYRNGIIDAAGRFLGTAGEKNYITLWKDNEKEIRVTQKDIRELQLAKGAIYAGIELLLMQEEISSAAVDKIYLAGAFGSGINIKKAFHIGLLPDIGTDRVDYIGNGALAGASKILFNQISRSKAEQISRSARHLELALCDNFQEEFLKALSFPLML